MALVGRGVGILTAPLKLIGKLKPRPSPTAMQRDGWGAEAGLSWIPWEASPKCEANIPPPNSGPKETPTRNWPGRVCLSQAPGCHRPGNQFYIHGGPERNTTKSPRLCK